MREPGAWGWAGSGLWDGGLGQGVLKLLWMRRVRGWDGFRGQCRAGQGVKQCRGCLGLWLP